MIYYEYKPTLSDLLLFSFGYSLNYEQWSHEARSYWPSFLAEHNKCMLGDDIRGAVITSLEEAINHELHERSNARAAA